MFASAAQVGQHHIRQIDGRMQVLERLFRHVQFRQRSIQVIAQFSFQRFQSIDIVRTDCRIVQQRADMRQFAFHRVELFGICSGSTDLLNFTGFSDGSFRLLFQRI